MRILYNPEKSNLVVNALSRVFIGSMTRIVDEKKELVKKVHIFSQLVV